MSTRPHGRLTAHHVEATGPGGQHLDLVVLSRSRQMGSVRVVWDPAGIAEPRFPVMIPWGSIGLFFGIAFVVVLVGWLVIR